MAQDPNWSPLFVATPVFRFRLKQLFLWTAFIALGCVALRSASSAWVSGMLGLTLLALGASLLLALFRDGRQRAYWIGFATAGWLYVFVLLYAWNLDSTNVWGNPLRPEDLATARLTHKVFAWMYPPVLMPQTMYGGMGMPGGGVSGPNGAGMMPMGMGVGGSDAGMGGYGVPMGPGGGSAGMPAGMMGGSAGTMMLPPTAPSQQDFTNVAHALWTLLLASCGGWLATWLHATRPKAREGTADDADRRGE